MPQEESTPEPRVLVIEDDPAVGRMLQMALRQAGFAVAMADNGRDAMRSLNQAGADAVVLDLGLPDGGAPAVLDWVHHRPAVSWLVMSAIDPNEAAKRYGPFHGHFIAKPFDPWQLVRRLEDQIRRQEA